MDTAIVVALIAAFGGGGVTSLIQYLISRNDRKKENPIQQKFEALEAQQKLCEAQFERSKLVEDLCLAFMQDRIVTGCDECIKKGGVTIRERAMLDAMYQPYSQLGGNHYAQEAMEELQKLPIITR